MRIPSVIRNFTLRKTGNAAFYYGTADIELPTFTAITMELLGGGISGKTEVVIPGHFNPVYCKIVLHTPDSEFIDFGSLNGDNLEARGIIQGKDGNSGKRYERALRVTMRAEGAKALTPGKLTPGEKADSTVELSLDYVSYFLDGTKVMEYDPYSYKFFINNTDMLAVDRQILGIV